MLLNVNLPSSLLTVPVTNALSFSVFRTIFTKGSADLSDLFLINPDIETPEV